MPDYVESYNSDVTVSVRDVHAYGNLLVTVVR